MRKYFSIISSVVTLSAVVMVTLLWSGRFFDSLENYRSPLSEMEVAPPPGDELPQQVQVVVVLVSGLGSVDLQNLELPLLAQLSRIGASAVIQSAPPSFGQTSRATLISAAASELNGAPLIDRPIEALSPITIDTIFARAHDHRLRTALLGPDEWRRLIPASHLDETLFVNVAGPEADQLLVENALLLLDEDNTDLLFVHLTQLGFAAMLQGGPQGEAYNQAAATVEAHLGQINKSMNYGDGVLVILGDHGHTEDGGYGGAEPEVTRQPFLMIGNPVTPGSYSDIRQVDVAPTLSTLLGIAPPAASQGRILFEMLRLDAKERTVAQLALARQRLGLVTAYTAGVGQAPLPTAGIPATDLEQAQAAFDQGNINGAFQLAQLVTETADAHILQARQSLVQTAQRPRLLVSAPLLVIWLLLMWRLRGGYVSIVIVAAVATVGLYHILYQLQGFEYSISSFVNFADLPFSIARRTVVSMLAGGGLILIILMLVSEKNWLTLLGVGYGFSVLVTFLFALPLFWTFWQNGLAIAGYVPPVDIIFWQITATFEAMIAATLGLFLPWPIMLLLLFVNFVRDTLDRTRPRQEADALPGLHM